MTKLTFKSKYSSPENKVSTTLGAWVDEVKLKATFTDKSIRHASFQELDEVVLGIEKPGHFMIDYELEKGVFRYQFHSGCKVLGKPVKLTLNHFHGRPSSSLEADVSLDHRNRVIAKQNLFKTSPSLKFSHTYDGKTTLEPSYDFSEKSWAVSLKQSFSKRSFVKVSYHDQSKKAELEWHQPIDKSGPLKVIASASVSGNGKPPSITFEKEWAF